LLAVAYRSSLQVVESVRSLSMKLVSIAVRWSGLFWWHLMRTTSRFLIRQ
jgi:hypothetical protein